MRNSHLPRSPAGNSNKNDRSLLVIRTLRQKIVTGLSLLMLTVAALAFPSALHSWVSGSVGPVLISVSALAFGAFALASARSGRTALAAKAQTIYIAGSGLALSVLDPALLDLGLAQLFLGIIHAALFCDRNGGGNRVLLAAALAMFAGISSASVAQMSLESITPLFLTAALNCIAIAAAQIYFALRLHWVANLHAKSHNKAISHLLDHMGDGYMRFSHKGDLIFSSKATERLLGAPSHQLAGAGFGERVHIADRPAFFKGFSDATHSSGTKIIEVRVRKDDVEGRARAPEFIWIELFLSPVSTKAVEQNSREVVALLRNITRRKDQELEMASAREAAEEASLTKSRFLATIGHELRTPLNAIVGFSEMMRNGIGGSLEPTHQEYAQLIQQSGHHLLEVVNMLMDMSRIEAGKFELQLAQFGPECLADPCLRMVEACARERNIKLVSDIAEPLPALNADERACRQILINLLSNAVKFSNDDGEVKLSIKRQGQKIMLSVSDTGIGMSQEATGRIGEPFFQAHGELNREYEGTGLGLSIVKGLVELHDGRMLVKSKIGRGTKMTVFLPIHGPETDIQPNDNISSLRPPLPKIETNPWPEQKRIAQ